MNFILTSILLAGITFLGYMIGVAAVPEHITLVTVVFFFIALIVRFMPKVFGELLGAGADLLS